MCCLNVSETSIQIIDESEVIGEEMDTPEGNGPVEATHAKQSSDEIGRSR